MATTSKVAKTKKHDGTSEETPDDPHPGWHFYNELLKALREDIVRNRVSTDNLSENVKQLNSTMVTFIEIERQSRLGRRVSERTASSGRRMSDRKGTGEKAASKRK